MWGAILQALRLAAPAALGYFVNDVFSWIGATFKSLSPFDDQNRIKPIYLIAYLILGGFAITLLFSFLMKGKKGSKIFFLLIFAGWIYQMIFPEHGLNGEQLATALITLTTGAAVLTPQNSTYIPKYFWYTAATQLTGVKLTVQGDGVVFDFDANGLNHCGVNRLLGQVTNTYLFRLANGIIPGKNVLWEFTNSAAQTPTIYVDSDETPVQNLSYLQGIRQPILGPGGTDLSNFATLSLPSLSATDYCNILWNDGTQQSNMLRVDLQALLMLTQNVVNTPIYQIDNWNQRVKKVNIQVSATQTAYIQRWVRPVANGMINQAPIARG